MSEATEKSPVIRLDAHDNVVVARVPIAKGTMLHPENTRMPEDMDINAGTIIDGEQTLEQVGEEIFERMIAVASGEKTASERFGMGDEEYIPWAIGATG